MENGNPDHLTNCSLIRGGFCGNKADHHDENRSNCNGFYEKCCDVPFVDRGRVSNSPGCSGFIEHNVSKFDTLAGVAIKYGVEVVDIKRINGLSTELQMYAFKSIHIPLSGRHPPSTCTSNGSNNSSCSSTSSTPDHTRSDFFNSFHSVMKPKKAPPPHKISAAMSSLQGYYGLKPANPRRTDEGYEMTVYKKGDSPITPPPYRKSGEDSNGFTNEHSSESTSEKIVRRRQKSEVEFDSPEILLKEDDANGATVTTTPATVKGLALRPKSAGRVFVPSFPELNGSKQGAVLFTNNTVVPNGFSGVRKSSSTPSLSDQNSGSSGISSIWSASVWNLKSDLQALSSAAMAKPIFDGLPKPVMGRRTKAALD